MNDFELPYKYKNTTLVQPEVKFGVYPPSKTEKKLVSRYVGYVDCDGWPFQDRKFRLARYIAEAELEYEKSMLEKSLKDRLLKLEYNICHLILQMKLKEFVKEQYWVLVDFFHGQPGGGEREISYTRETGLTLHSFEEIASKLGISSSQESGTSSSQEVGISGFNLGYSESNIESMKLKYEVSQELSNLTGENVTISEKTSKQHITRIPPQPFEWYFAIYQLIDVYTINTIQYRQEHIIKKITRQKEYYSLSLLGEINFESGLKQYSSNSDYIFKSHTFEVPTLYFCEKCDPPLK